MKRSYNRYCDNAYEIENLQRTLFKVLCDKQIQLRFFQEKEILLKGYNLPNTAQILPTIIQLNKEFKLRKQLQEIELIARFLIDDQRFAAFVSEVERGNEIFDLAIESGLNHKLENAVHYFNNLFGKILNSYDLEPDFMQEFIDFRSQISLQANGIALFTPIDVESRSLAPCYRKVMSERIALELEVDRLLYQFSLFQSGKKIIFAEIKNASGALESILFKEYALKQKVQELKQYKVDLNNQKEDFMKDPTVDGYTEAVQQLEHVETRFRRLMMHKNFEKPDMISHFFALNKTKTESKLKTGETAYNKNLFQVLHNSHVTSQDKMLILRLSKPSKLINTVAGKFFYQRVGRSSTLRDIEQTTSKLQAKDLH